MKRHRVRVVVVNAQRGNRRMPAMRALLLMLRPALIIVSEAQDLGSLRGYARCGAMPEAKWQARDCAVYVRADRFGIIGHSAVKGSEAVPDRPVQHERWYVRARVHLLEAPNVIFEVFSVHGNAAIENRAGEVPDSKGARQSAALFDHVREASRWTSALGHHVLVGGDFNVSARSSWSWAPRNLYPRFRGDHLEGLAWSKGLTLKRFRTLPAPGVAAPHRVLLARLEVNA